MKTEDTLAKLAESAAEASQFLSLLANQNRLLLLCHLGEGECSVGRLADAIGLSQSALSQHLQKLREDEMVETRREGQTIYYRIKDPRVKALIGVLYEQFCAAPKPAKRK
jgi:DNA-binding transcriptional ArsR family regulator